MFPDIGLLLYFADRIMKILPHGNSQPFGQLQRTTFGIKNASNLPGPLSFISAVGERYEALW
jgi:hypothetical protein